VNVLVFFVTLYLIITVMGSNKINEQNEKRKDFKLIIKVMLIIAGIAVIYIISIFDPLGLDYGPDGLVRQFNRKSNEIYEVKRYINSIVPKYKNVEIEFESGEEIANIVISPIDTGRGADLTVSGGSNFKIESKKADSLLLILGWKIGTFDALKEKLDDANCISIESGEPAKIGYKRSGLGMYFFNVFDKPIPDSLKSRYNDSCRYLYANQKLVLEYNGGAVGGQCFFNKGK